MGPGQALMPMELLREPLLRLDRLGVDVAVPPPDTCGELPPAPGCHRPLHACTTRLSGEQDGVAWERLVVTLAPFARAARWCEDDGTQLTWGQPLTFARGTCGWAHRPLSAALAQDHATFVLSSTLERAGAPLATMSCRLVIADACNELAATVCVVELPQARKRRSPTRHVRAVLLRE